MDVDSVNGKNQQHEYSNVNNYISSLLTTPANSPINAKKVKN